MGLFNKKELSELDIQINRLSHELALMDPEDEGYSKISKNLEELHKIKQIETETRNAGKVRPDTVAEILGSIASIVMVLQYEQIHVIAGKAWNMISKIRR